MAKVTLTDMGSGYNLAAISSNMQLLANALNNDVLYRNNPSGEANQMVDTNLDMNSQEIINVAKPTNLNSAARLADIVSGGTFDLVTDAADVTFTPTTEILSTNVQAALEELQTHIDEIVVPTNVIPYATVSTMAAFKALDSTKVTTAFVTGYYSANDGGGGMYYVASTTANPAWDNGGTQISGTDGACWQRAQRPTDELNMRVWGVKFDGTTDDTVNFQKALTSWLYLKMPSGNAILTGPLTVQPNAQLRGAGMLQTRLQRSGNWAGDTLKCGNATTGIPAGNVIFSDFLIEQLHPGFTIGTSTTMTDQLTAGQGHIVIHGGYNCLVKNIWFQHAVYQLTLVGCVKARIEDIHSYGSWDWATPAVSETIATVFLNYSTVVGYQFSTEVRMTRMYIGTGGPSAARTQTIGNATYSAYDNIGPKYGILVQGVEGLEVTDSYIGGCGMDCVAFNPSQICSMINFTNIFFDECYQNGVTFYPVAGFSTSNITFDGCKWNAQGHQKRAIYSYQNDTASSVYGLSVNGGFMVNHSYCPVYLEGATGVILSDVIYGAYNYHGDTSGNTTISSAAYIETNCANVHIMGALCGGGVNNWSTSNNCRYGIAFASSASGSASNVRAILGQAGGYVCSITQTYPT